VVFDLGAPVEVSRWRLLSAGAEHPSYITRTCLLEGRNSASEEWRTLDMFDANRSNTVDRSFAAASVRYVRLFVVNPTQGSDSAARIYNFELF
jgi:alpha-mannosidase